MTEVEFIDYWTRKYPESLPIGHGLKWIYQDRWYRIHNLPESKRYAETEEEFKIILKRQNQLIEDLIGEETEIVTLFGLYTDDLSNGNYKELSDFNSYNKISTIDLHKEASEEYEDNTYLDIYIKIDKWKRGDKNEMLLAIAEDEIRAILICPSKH